jgi:hypothetical protein
MTKYRPLEFPKEKDNTAVEFISTLLKKKPHERVCSLFQLKENEFFNDFNFV